MKAETQLDPQALNRIEVPQEVADALLQNAILPRLVEEYLDIVETMEEAAVGGAS